MLKVQSQPFNYSKLQWIYCTVFHSRDELL